MKKYISTSSNIFALLFYAMIFFSCHDESAHQQEDSSNNNTLIEFTEAQFKNAEIKFGKLEMRNISTAIQCNGVLDVPPQNLISISLPIGGILKSTELLEGMKVKKGQLIASFEHPDYVDLQQEYIKAKSALDFGETEYKRQENLNKENVTSEKSLQRSKTELTSLQAQVNGLENKLEQLGIPLQPLNKGIISSTIYITSPINGYVTKVNTNVGKYVNANDVAFEIVDTEHLHVELTVYEKDISKIKIGQNIRFILANESDNERGAKVYLIGKEIENDRTIRIHAHLDKEDIELLPGMYVKAKIEVGENKCVTLPDQAIVQNQGKNYVFIAEKSAEKNKHYFKMIEVNTGISENGFTEITMNKEISNASEVVVNGAYDILSKKFNNEEEGADPH